MIIRVIELNEAGKEALIQHHKDSLKMGFQKKAMMKTLGIKQRVANEKPYTIELEITNKRLSSLINPEHIINEVKKFMTSQNTELGKDYKVMIE